VKSALRFSRASGSTRRKVEAAIRHGWQPGVRFGDVLSRKRKGVGRRA
jgi:hypothetical protein